VSITGQPHSYANDDPINEDDPLGLGCGIIAVVCNMATQAWNDTGGQAVSADSQHWHGIAQVATVVASGLGSAACIAATDGLCALPKVAMVLDTSGSMNDQMLSQLLAEVEGVLRGLGVGRRHLRIVCCDAKAFEAQKVLQARDVELLGGGGTGMGAGLAKAAELRPRPDLIIVLTDGYTPWPSAPPSGIRVIVGLMDAMGVVPDWARAILIGSLAA